MKAPLDQTAQLPWEDSTSVRLASGQLPGISIVIPIFNSGIFLEKTLRSLLCNDLSGCEVIVMDGGSTDQTQSILDHYDEMFTIRVSERDEGQSDAINKGFLKATRPILYWLNGDDIILPNALTDVREFFSAHHQCDFLVGNAYMTEADFTPIRHFVFSEEQLSFSYLIDYASNHLVQPSVFFSRRAWSVAGPVKRELNYSMDADLFLAIATNFKGYHLNLDLSYSVYHEGCKTRAHRAESITELAIVQASHGGIEHAAKTLRILVQIHQDVESQLADKMVEPCEVDANCCSRCHIIQTKLTAITEEYVKNRQLILLGELDV